MLIRLLAATTMLCTLAGTASAEYALTVLHTNDFHARFEPINSSNSTCGEKEAAEGKCFGGTARLVTAIKDARGRTNNSILVDGGDQFQGSLFYTYYKGAASAEFMNKLGYDAMTVGNHEFDDGPEVLRGFMETVQFPVLMSNADVSQEPILKDIMHKSVVIEKGGEKIGLIGLTPIDTPEIAAPGKNVIFTDPVPAVQEEVDKLTAEGVNKIIVLSHSGYNVDKRVAAETTGVDVIVGGHTNTYLSNTSDKAEGPYPTMVGDTAIVSAYAYGKFLGELNVTFDDAGKVISAKGEPLIMDKAVAEDAPTVERIAEMAKPLNEIREKVVAESSGPIEGGRDICRQQECEMGNLVAEAQLDRVREQGISISLVNGGGLRASIDAGPVTMGEVLTVLPFQNTLATFQTSGKTVLAALENGVSQLADGAGRFLQVAGLRYAFDAAAEPGKRVSKVEVMEDGKWVPLDEGKTYGVVVNNYVRNGGDGFAMFLTDAQNPYDFGPDLADVVAEYMVKTGPYTPALDGRITRTN